VDLCGGVFAAAAPNESTQPVALGRREIVGSNRPREVELKGGGLETRHGMLLTVVVFFLSASHIGRKPPSDHRASALNLGAEGGGRRSKAPSRRIVDMTGGGFG
jgi:hypothetical protein